MMHTPTTAEILRYELEIPIKASKEKVWKSLTEETNAWWLPDFHVVGEGSVITFDARAGGHLIETKEGGGSLLWYTVTMVTPERSIHMVGHMAPEWGGPATTMLELALVENDGETLFRVRDAIYGNASASSAKSLEDGWRKLFTEGLAAHAEQT